MATIRQFSSSLGRANNIISEATGGGTAAPATPTSQAQLVTWLSDSTPRVILLTTMMDFTTFSVGIGGFEVGTSTAELCSPWSCTPNPQQKINTANNFCAQYPGKTNATFNNAGTTNSFYLFVGSNKTLLGKGANAGLNGVGLRLTNSLLSSTFIDGPVTISFSARYVWGGDATNQRLTWSHTVQIDGASNTGIDHNYFNRIGRQFIVTGFGAANGVTISNNYFDGHADFSTGCDGHQYWVGLLGGDGDRITFANNYIFFHCGTWTARRRHFRIRLQIPHCQQSVPFPIAPDTRTEWNDKDYYSSITGHALDIDLGAFALAEGNYFDSVNQPSTSNVGILYFPQTSADASACTSHLGRACQVNTLAGSGAVASTIGKGDVWGALAGDAVVSAYNIMTAAAAKTFVLANAGTGKVN
ncbi:putative pectin lyase D [Mycena latifolia]|nr:putative pectin lyase D [Mycena latifolia]